MASARNYATYIAAIIAILLVVGVFLGVNHWRNGGSTSTTISQTTIASTHVTTPMPTSIPTTTAQPVNYSCPNATRYDLTVPSSWVSLYSELNQSLDNFSQTLGNVSSKPNHTTIYGAELLAADANSGTSLLNPQAMASVNRQLNALQAMGVNGVTVDISFPLFLPNFPNSSRYIAFYKQVAQAIHSRNMTMVVEYHVIFTGTSFSSLTYNYSNLTFQQLLRERQQMAQILISNISPDIVDLGSEPETTYTLLQGSGRTYPELLTPEGWYNYTIGSVSGVNTGSTRIAAGLGSWDSPTDIKYIANESKLSYISLHIYPLLSVNQQNVIEDAAIAQEHGKPLLIDEAWEWKESQTKPYANVDVNESMRGPWSFWMPIDKKFLSDLIKYADKYNVAYISPFHIQSFFAYVNYSSVASLSSSQENALLNQQASQGIQNGALSQTGCHYKNLISKNQ
ncbi:MAG: hypothetical protein KGH72_00510 [Candidatus Micrarchaeota archaeon]|nr:hypothetical protein [Candidatus Micrarchaeota archaeon]